MLTDRSDNPLRGINFPKVNDRFRYIQDIWLFLQRNARTFAIPHIPLSARELMVQALQKYTEQYKYIFSF